MNARTVVTAIIALVLFAAAAAIVYKRFGPPRIPTEVTLTSVAGETLTYVWSGVGPDQRGEISPGQTAKSRYFAGSRLDLYLPKMDIPAGSWVVSGTDGNITIEVQGVMLSLAGNGLEATPVEQ